MPQGLELLNASGHILANTDFLNYFCRRSGTGTTVTRTIGSTLPSQAVIPFGSLGYNDPLLFIYCTQPISFIQGVSNGSNTYGCAGAIGTAFEWFIFDKSSNLPASTNGIEAYNGSSQRVFSSAHRPLVCTAIRTQNTSGNQDYSLSGRKLAFAQFTYAGHRFDTELQCWDSGFGQFWDGFSFCGDLRYQNNGKLYGAQNIAEGTVRIPPAGEAFGNISFDDVQISAGTSDFYTVPDDVSVAATFLIADVTGIPLNQTFW
jgi:hypothetical protein